MVDPEITQQGIAVIFHFAKIAIAKQVAAAAILQPRLYKDDLQLLNTCQSVNIPVHIFGKSPSIQLTSRYVQIAGSVWNMNRPCRLESTSLPPTFSVDMPGNSDFGD